MKIIQTSEFLNGFTSKKSVCSGCDQKRLYNRGQEEYLQGNYGLAAPLLQMSLAFLGSREISCCGFERSALMLMELNNSLTELYREVLIRKLAASEDAEKINLFLKLNDVFSCNNIRSLLFSGENFRKLISENEGLQEVDEYAERIEALDRRAMFLYDTIRSRFPEEGLPPLE